MCLSLIVRLGDTIVLNVNLAFICNMAFESVFFFFLFFSLLHSHSMQVHVWYILVYERYILVCHVCSARHYVRAIMWVAIKCHVNFWWVASGLPTGQRVLMLQPPPPPTDTLTHDPIWVTKLLSNTGCGRHHACLPHCPHCVCAPHHPCHPHPFSGDGWHHCCCGGGGMWLRLW